MLALTLSSVDLSWRPASAWLSGRWRLLRVVGGRRLLLLEGVWVAWSWLWAVWRLSMVVVTLPVAMEEYSERMPLVFGFDENIWVTWLVVPLLV